MKAIMLLMLAAVMLSGCMLSGCASTPRSPYDPISEAERDGSKAEKLCHQAAKIIRTDPARAEKLLCSALAADLYHGPSHNNLGTIYLSQGNLYLAAGEFEWARKLLPGSPDPRMNLALTLERAGRTDEALQAYQNALEVQPEHLATIQALARLQLRSGRADERTRERLEIIALRGDPIWQDWAKLQLARDLPSLP